MELRLGGAVDVDGLVALHETLALALGRDHGVDGAVGDRLGHLKYSVTENGILVKELARNTNENQRVREAIYD